MPNDKDKIAPTLSKAPSEHYWDWLLHEDGLFSGRINFFLIAESMLFIAFAINSYENPHLTTVLSMAGLLFVAIWLYVSIIQIFFLINPIKKRLRKELPEYREMKGTWLFGDPNIWLGIVFPAVLVLIWILLMIEE